MGRNHWGALGALFALGLIFSSDHAEAQGVNRICLNSIGANGSNNCVDIGPSNPMPVSGSFSASLGGFTPTPSYSQIAASDALNHSVAVPTGVDDVISNLDSNIAYCNFGAASTTGTFPIPAGATFGFHNPGGAFATVQCQSPNSTLKITISGGAGLFTGGGGGGGSGGSGGTVAQGTAASSGPWIVTPWIGGAVNAVSNPLFFSPGTGATFASTQSGPWTVALGAGAASIGTIGNTGFNITGTLPAFAATPTFNLGTLNGAATAALQTTGNADLVTINNSVLNGSANDGATAAGVSTAVGCSYNTTQPTLSNGQQNTIQCDIHGLQLIDYPQGNAVLGNLAGGTSPGSLANSDVMGCYYQTGSITLSNTNSIAAECDSSGRWLVNAAAAVWAGSTASAVPASADYVGANSSGNLTGIIQADKSVAINIGTATTTQLIALSGSTKIYITQFDVIAGGTGNITFEYGTGTNCGTGTTPLTGAYNLTAQSGLSGGSGLGPKLIVPAGNAFCALTSQAVQMSGSASYTQF